MTEKQLDKEILYAKTKGSHKEWTQEEVEDHIQLARAEYRRSQREKMNRKLRFKLAKFNMEEPVVVKVTKRSRKVKYTIRRVLG